MPSPLTERRAISLATSQQHFVEALLRLQPGAPADVAGASEAQRLKRFSVYRNNVHASLAAAVAARFPVIERLVGEEFFRAMALVFIEGHPPTSPVLSEYGGDFAVFLEGFVPAQDFPYLPDIARLEWARNVAYHATDALPVAIAELAALPPDRLDDARLVLHPSVTLIASPYPIVSIWRTNTHDEVVQPIGPELGGEFALVTRPALDVLVTELPNEAAAFMDALLSGGSLGDAANTASAASELFDLPATLAAIFSSGAIVRIDQPPTLGTTP